MKIELADCLYSGNARHGIKGEQFMPVQQCESKACRENKVNGLEDGPKMLESRLVRLIHVAIGPIFYIISWYVRNC